MRSSLCKCVLMCTFIILFYFIFFYILYSSVVIDFGFGVSAVSHKPRIAHYIGILFHFYMQIVYVYFSVQSMWHRNGCDLCNFIHYVCFISFTLRLIKKNHRYPHSGCDLKKNQVLWVYVYVYMWLTGLLRS